MERAVLVILGLAILALLARILWLAVIPWRGGDGGWR